MAKEQMEKALQVSERVPEFGTELHREKLLSKLLDEAVVAGALRAHKGWSQEARARHLDKLTIVDGFSRAGYT